jgi:hypothetical protein
MAGILKSSQETYEFGLDQMKELIAADLQVHVDCVTVRYVIQEVGGDPMDRFPGRDQVTKIEVTVDKTKGKSTPSYDDIHPSQGGYRK